MINVNLSHVKNVAEFYKDIRAGQEAEHGKDYCAQHDAIRKYFKLGYGCTSYKELGVHQGGTAANAMLMGAKYIELVDISMVKYNKYLRPLAAKHCKDNDIDLVIREADSTGLGSIGKAVDMMLIDSVHKWFHTEKELTLHANNVKKYIVFHDTATCHDIANGVEHWCETKPWKIIEIGKANVGYTVIERI